MLEWLVNIGGPVLRGRYKDAKKTELANACASLCNGRGIVEAEIREKAAAWLPDVMRFDGIETPERLQPHSDFLGDPEEDDDRDEVELADDEQPLAQTGRASCRESVCQYV